MDPVHVIAACVFAFLYIWLSYNLLILAFGVRQLKRTSNSENYSSNCLQPFFSIIVPVKNEEKVIGRLLDALLNLNYSRNKFEIIIVEDGSTDATPKICAKYAEEYPDRIKFIRKKESKGKPSALNFGLKFAKGDIIGVFDADSVPEPDVLMKVVEYFEDPSIAAVQGATVPINADENFLTKFITYEQAVFRVQLRGKDELNLFVPLTGSCQFIRREILDIVGGFNEDSLAEDVELAAKLTDMGYEIKYAPQVKAMQEIPSKVGQLFKQRTRWYRGYMEAAIKYGKILKKPSLKSLDVELTLTEPYVLILCFLGYIMAFYSILFPSKEYSFNPFLLISQATLIVSLMLMFIVGLALIYITKPRRLANILWLPFIYAYWMIETFIAINAAIQIMLRRPRKWVKTNKSGSVVLKSSSSLLMKV